MIEAAARAAKWQWSVWDGNKFIAAAALVPDMMPGRGWFTGYPSDSMDAVRLRPLIRVYRAFVESGAVFQELRAWVASDDDVAIGFANRFGFEYDCGPATGLSPSGRDMDLMIRRL